jgi:hypothetical protein
MIDIHRELQLQASKTKRYKDLAQHLVLAQVHERPWRRARKTERQEEDDSTDWRNASQGKKRNEK